MDCIISRLASVGSVRVIRSGADLYLPTWMKSASMPNLPSTSFRKSSSAVMPSTMIVASGDITIWSAAAASAYSRVPAASR